MAMVRSTHLELDFVDIERYMLFIPSKWIACYLSLMFVSSLSNNFEVWIVTMVYQRDPYEHVTSDPKIVHTAPAVRIPLPDLGHGLQHPIIKTYLKADLLVLLIPPTSPPIKNFFHMASDVRRDGIRERLITQKVSHSHVIVCMFFFSSLQYLHITALLFCFPTPCS
jgi:hypothetical protein